MNQNYAYLAGLIDAEGCLRIDKKRVGKQIKYKPSICIAMTDKWILEWVTSIFPASIYVTKKIIHKDMYLVRYQSENTRKILPLIYPFLRVKKAQADILFKVLKMKDNHLPGSHVSLQNDYEILFKQISQLKKLNFHDYQELPKIVLFDLSHEFSYLAGLIDGDGSIQFSQNEKLTRKLTISMNQPEGILAINTLFGGNISKDLHGSHKQFRLQLCGENCLKALAALEPYLKLKKLQAQEVLKSFNK